MARRERTPAFLLSTSFPTLQAHNVGEDAGLAALYAWLDDDEGDRPAWPSRVQLELMALVSWLDGEALALPVETTLYYEFEAGYVGAWDGFLAEDRPVVEPLYSVEQYQLAMIEEVLYSEEGRL